MIALELKENHTKTRKVSQIRVVAIKKPYSCITGFHIVFSLESERMFVSGKNFARKTWATFNKAVDALNKIHEEQSFIFLSESRLDVCFQCWETEHQRWKHIETYGKPIKTYYLNTSY